MEINIKDQVVILDEAHNMEDISRDSAGDKIGDDALEKAINELDEMSQCFDVSKLDLPTQ
jgi:Fanconi anemia group J protein